MRSAFFLVFLTIGLITVIFFFGIPLVVRYAGLVTDIKQSSSPVNSEDSTPPPPPRLDDITKATNQTSIDINGSSEPGSTIVIFLNGDSHEVLTNKSGRFSYTAKLLDGDNTLKAIARDQKGNESAKTKTYEIVHDNNSPNVEIILPADGTEFYGSRQRQINIEGATEPDAKITINERFVVVGNDGKFKYTTNLSEGENTFTIKVEDNAGNASEKSLTISYSE